MDIILMMEYTVMTIPHVLRCYVYICSVQRVTVPSIL